MGVGWPIAAVVAGLAIVAITLPLVLSSGGEPEAPFVDVGAIDAVPAAGSAFLDAGAAEVLVVRGTGSLLAFLDASEGAAFCPASRRIEDGERAWTVQGRLVVGEGSSLRPVAVSAFEDRLFVNIEEPAEPLPPNVGQEQLGC